MKKLFSFFAPALLFAGLLLPGISNAQFTVLADFTGNGAFSGSRPVRDQNLIKVDSALYSMVANGGLYEKGVLFKIMPDGSGYTKILDFDGPTRGASPYASLMYDGTYLYGTTAGGGSMGSGTVFKIKPDGTSYTELHAFTNSEGYMPSSTLVSDGTYLYGLVAYGGPANQGGIFKIKPDGSDFTVLYSFLGLADGGYPYGSLTLVGSTLYGMTNHAGTHDLGVAFKIATDGSAYSVMVDFDGSNGSSPEGNSFYYDGTSLYGLTPRGGTYNNGIMFKVQPDGTGYTTLFNFQSSVTGEAPKGKLFSDGTSFYATLQYGGGGYGKCFKIQPDGTGFTSLYNFDGYIGNNPNSSFISDGTYLYSMVNSGGANNSGIIFKLKPDGTDYNTLFNFADATNGHAPHGNLAFDGTWLYGTTWDGGAHNFGVIYKVRPDGTGYTLLHDFVFYDGYNPTGSLYYDGTYLYGATANGGINYQGVIFRMFPDGTGYEKLYSFNTTDGSYPGSSALSSDGTWLYGTTNSNGANGYGTAYKIMKDGTNFTKLHDFGNTDGSMPNGLVSDGSALYGMTYAGGANNKGVIYKVQPDGTGFTKLVDLDEPVTGANPGGGLTWNGTSLYGMTLTGGPDYGGTLFKIQPDGSGFNVLVAFNGANGQYPRAGTLLSHNGYLYGMTEQGGATYRGTIFKIKPDGTDHTILYSFTAASGSYPDGSLITDGTSFYGTTYYAGTVNAGTVFKLCPAATLSQSLTVCNGESITVGGNTYTASGTYIDTFHPVNACDSIVTTNLTVLGPVTGTLEETVCYGTPVTVGGTTYTSGGIYTQVYTAGSAAGCDSTVTITINMYAAIDESVTANGATLTANAFADSYQWIDCDNGNAPIGGENSQSFTATADGNYAVILTIGTCTVTSACSNVTTTGISQYAAKAPLSIYPNPNNGTFVIKAAAEGTYLLVNSLGQTIQSFRLTAADNYSFAINNLVNGIYFIKNDQGAVQQKIVVAK